jgi:hypothetical protein
MKCETVALDGELFGTMTGFACCEPSADRKYSGRIYVRWEFLVMKGPIFYVRSVIIREYINNVVDTRICNRM